MINTGVSPADHGTDSGSPETWEERANVARKAGRRGSFVAAAVQMTSTADVERNVSRAVALVDAAARAGADLVALPENFAYLREEGASVAFRETLGGPVVRELAEAARRHRIHLLLGSIPEAARGGRVHNTSVLLGPAGDVLATYRKLHLFDIRMRGRVVLDEGRFVSAGRRAVVADTALGRLGLSICYDLRFPELYRRLTLDLGADVLFVPAAFTAFTGPHHWLPLLRARAIENQCWVVAPAQVGRHNEKRRSHGESAIIDPWGRVVARRLRGEGWISARIDHAATRSTRSGLPCLEHARRDLRASLRRARTR